MSLLPNSQLRPEQLLAYELGYRFEPVPRLSVDVATYFDRYSQLIVSLPGDSQFVETTPAHVLVGLMEQNAQDAKNYGFEAALQWQATS